MVTIAKWQNAIIGNLFITFLGKVLFMIDSIEHVSLGKPQSWMDALRLSLIHFLGIQSDPMEKSVLYETMEHVNM